MKLVKVFDVYGGVNRDAWINPLNITRVTAYPRLFSSRPRTEIRLTGRVDPIHVDMDVGKMIALLEDHAE